MLSREETEHLRGIASPTMRPLADALIEAMSLLEDCMDGRVNKVIAIWNGETRKGRR